MQLLCSPNSPYVRKIRVFLREKQLSDQVSEVMVDPLHDGKIRKTNPLGKVPVLLLPNAEPLFDSPLIIEYLDATLKDTSSAQISGEQCWQTLRWQALADGMMDAAVAIVFEKNRTDATPSAFWMDRWATSIKSGVAVMERQADCLADYPDIGSIATGCMLGYLDFRHADLAWRSAAPRLARWYEAIVSRQSMLATMPVE